MTATHQPGDYLYHNQYRIEEILGIGGQGVVYRALHLGLGEPVAIKELFDSSVETRDHFRWQAQMLRRLTHPALPRVMDFFESGQQTYLVMDYIAGQDLDRRVAQQGVQPVQHVLAWSNTILDAFHYLHSQQPSIIHRDLKPANLKLTPDGKLYLVDFGLAKVGGMGSTTVTVAKGLTHGFAPLEQYGGRTGPRSDIYALGATLYYLLTAQAPLSANLRGSGERMSPLQTLNPSVPTNIATWINKAIALRRDERWPTADAMRQTMPPPPAISIRHPPIPTPHPRTEALRYQNTTSVPTQVPSRQSQRVPTYQTGAHSQRRSSQPRKKKGGIMLPAALGVVALLLVLVIGGGLWSLTSGSASEANTAASVVLTEVSQDVEATTAAESAAAAAATATAAESAAATEDAAAVEGAAAVAGEGESDNSAVSESTIVPTPTQEPTHTVPAGAPTSTRRPTFTPPPTETPAPPTATPEPVSPTNTSTQTTNRVAASPAVAASATSGEIAAASVPDAPTNTPLPARPTNTPVSAAPASYDTGPNALEPADGATINSDTVIFKWGWNGPALGNGQQFRVMGFRDGEWLEFSKTTGTESQVWMPGFGNFETAWEWYVVVIDSAGNEISPTSAKLNFGISLSSGGE